MTKPKIEESRAQKTYDIRERTFQFATTVVTFVNSLPRTLAAVELGRQLLRSGTSIGANVEEADAAETRRDFVHKMGIARKKAQETRYWLRLLRATHQDSEHIQVLLQEADELTRILSTIVRNARREGQNDKVKMTKPE